MRVNLLIILLSAALGALSVKTEFFTALLLVVAPIVLTWAAFNVSETLSGSAQSKIFGCSLPVPFVFFALYGAFFFGALNWVGLLTPLNFSICLPSLTLWCLTSAAGCVRTRREPLSKFTFLCHGMIYAVGILIALFFFRTFLSHVNWLDVWKLQSVLSQSPNGPHTSQVLTFALNVFMAAVTSMPIVYSLELHLLERTEKLRPLDLWIFAPLIHVSAFVMMFTIVTPIVAASPVGELVLGHVPTKAVVADAFRFLIAVSTVPSSFTGMFNAIVVTRAVNRKKEAI